MNLLRSDELIDRILSHIDNKTTDLGSEVWREPAANYLTQERFEAELELIRSSPVPFCPSAMLTENGSYVARTAAGTPIVVVRGEDGKVRAFINACRHRGMTVASGTGCKRALVCPYHSWTYSLDGSLKNIPGKNGFPDVDLDTHGLVQVGAEEKGGIVYVNQKRAIHADDLAEFPDFFSPEQQFFEEEALTDQANWKLLAETTMEGYHIKGLHRTTFYPYGLDNINVVEDFGVHSRITFPFRRINDLREIERSERTIEGMVTSVYQLFPNVSVSILSKHTTVTIFEPLSPTSTQLLIYRVTNKRADGSATNLEEAKNDADFVKGSGFDEDREAAFGIQQSINAGTNFDLTFGLFEKSIVRFHKNLKEKL